MEPTAAIPLIVVMPAYNEEGCIARVCGAWLDVARRHGGRLLVVNDGSRDATGAILDGLARTEPLLTVTHQPNRGHGPALMTAYRQALAAPVQYVFHVDSDDQFDPADFEALWDRRSGSKFLLGHRAARQDDAARFVITRALRLLVLLGFGARVPDANVPFRLMDADYLRRLVAHVPASAFAPNVLLSVLAAADGQDLMNVPVTHRRRRTGTVSIIRWRLVAACLASARDLAVLRLRTPAMLRALHSADA
ncbi:MAG TPA: glycosyltransferase family 2 protein [Candidatus Eisenbacteria bacterium]|nr:glycosyltransferase family 2 protein [Candidatus Eisenbacteria bacterium]